jgi:hypothetical protein
MASNRVKIFVGVGAAGLEKKINEWLGAEGAKAQVHGMTTAMAESQKPESNPPQLEQKIVVTIWYSEG